MEGAGCKMVMGRRDMVMLVIVAVYTLPWRVARNASVIIVGAYSTYSFLSFLASLSA